MGEVVNLNRFRKTRRRAEEEKQAAENRVRFGRTKAEKDLERRNQTLESTRLDGQKLDE